ncbi:helix-turn-helix domain-containing protein [Kitasatospora sp. NPDC096147]|uniref:helix-turn-helix domain-containing protein n=1 Tax=Kitasatospora sp. NPDC096147 TaxID=3364093 RepID=UPI00382EE6BE
MGSLADLPGLRLIGRTGAERLVAGVAEPDEEVADRLVRVEPQATERDFARLAAGRAVAVGVTVPQGEPSERQRVGAERHGLALLAVEDERSWLRVARRIGDARLREAQDGRAELARLLGHLRESAGPADRRLERLVEWLAHAVGGPVRLTTGRPGEPAVTAGAAGVLAGAGPATAELTDGRLRSAALDLGPLHVRLATVGRHRPYPVLAVGRTEPFDARAGTLLGHAADLIAPLVRVRRAEADRERLEEVRAALRVAVFQLLMGGEVTLAQRTAEGLAPGLLDAEEQRVYVLEGPAPERDGLARRCREALGDRALVVRCPAYDQHLIVVAPLHADPAGTAGPAGDRDGAGHAYGRDGADGWEGLDGWDRVGLTLREFVAGRPDRALGGSGRRPPAHTAGCYGDATRALAVARLRPDRAALYAAESRLGQLLDPWGAARWATGVLRPLHELPLNGRDQLLGTLHLGLEFPAVSAGRILGVSRNTVRARIDRAADRLGLDLDGVTGRTVLHLALQAAGSVSACAVLGTAGTPPPALGELLAAGPVSDWARAQFERLAPDGRALRGTLLAWVRADLGVERAAGELGLHPQTVREHLRAAERLLQRQLLSGGGGVYEVVLAFAALGELTLPEPRPAEPPPPNHG